MAPQRTSTVVGNWGTLSQCTLAHVQYLTTMPKGVNLLFLLFRQFCECDKIDGNLSCQTGVCGPLALFLWLSSGLNI